MNPLTQMIQLGERIACNLNDELPMKPQPHITPVSKPDKLDLSVLEKQKEWRSFAKKSAPTEPEKDPLANGFVLAFTLIGAAIVGYFSYEICGWLLKLGVPL